MARIADPRFKAEHTTDCPPQAMRSLPYAMVCHVDQGGCGRFISADFSGQVTDLDPDGSRRAEFETFFKPGVK